MFRILDAINDPHRFSRSSVGTIMTGGLNSYVYTSQPVKSKNNGALVYYLNNNHAKTKLFLSQKPKAKTPSMTTLA